MSIVYPEHTIFDKKDSSVKFPSLGICIYCYKKCDPSDLSDEHIIPLGLGGNLIFLKASCKYCQDDIHAYESIAINRILGPTRDAVNINSGRNRGRKNKRKQEYRIFDGALDGPPRTNEDGVTEIDLPISEKKIGDFVEKIIMYETYGNSFPGFISGRTPETCLPISLGIAYEKGEKEGGDKFSIYVEGISGAMLRLIAKIAHGYLMAYISTNSFKPMLNNLVRGRGGEELSFFIGSSYPSDPEPFLHQISMRRVVQTSIFHQVIKDCVVVKVRLFAHIPTPDYYVVAGTYL